MSFRSRRGQGKRCCGVGRCGTLGRLTFEPPRNAEIGGVGDSTLIRPRGAVKDCGRTSVLAVASADFVEEPAFLGREAGEPRGADLVEDAIDIIEEPGLIPSPGAGGRTGRARSRLARAGHDFEPGLRPEAPDP